MISKLNKKDYKSIMKVWEASVRSTHTFLDEKDIYFYKGKIPKKYLLLMNLYGIKEGVDIKAFMGIHDKKIEMLFVNTQNFKQGLGRELVEYAVNELDVCSVDVNEQNYSALDFYKKMGFKVKSCSPLDGAGKSYPILHLSLN